MSNVHPEGMCRDCRVEPAEELADGSLATRCRACADTRREDAATERQRRRGLGLCTCIGCPRQGHRRDGERMAHCLTHLKYFRAATARRKARRLDPRAG